MWIKDFPIMKNLSYLGHEKSVEILDVSLTLEMAIYGLSYYTLDAVGSWQMILPICQI